MKKKRGLKESKTRLSTRVVVADHQERSIRKGPSLVPPAQPSTINEWATPIIELLDSEKTNSRRLLYKILVSTPQLLLRIYIAPKNKIQAHLSKGK